MFRFLALAVLLLVLGFGSTPALADEGCAHNGRFTCTVIESSVRGYQCPTLYQEDLGGIGAATAREAAERTARIMCAAEASHALYGEVAYGDYSQADGGDRFTIRPAEVRVR